MTRQKWCIVQLKFNKEAFKKGVEENLRTLFRRTLDEATPQQIFQAVSYEIKEKIVENWMETQKAYEEEDPKMVYYMSMEFLMGRALGNNMINMQAYEGVKEALQEMGLDINMVEDQEPDAALGNGGLGRLAACFLDSLATLGYPAYGCGIRYRYGMFKQQIRDGFQVEVPDNWLVDGNPFELRRPEYAKIVKFGGYVAVRSDENGRNHFYQEGYQSVKLNDPPKMVHRSTRKGKLMNIRRITKKNHQCIIIFALLAIYYAYRLFHITPWYDETYTYINFINEGFWYSATHWPAPNNHIFFSMLSSLINWCGVYIGLRGISYLAAMGTVILLYKLFREFTSKTVSIITVLSYTLFLLTNRLAVQGRGYSLGTFFLMLAVYFGYRIAFKDEVKKKDYFLWAIALWLGLYTVVTSVYWVVGLCLSCGIVLLVLKKYKVLVKLVISSLIAAVFTTISYAIMWLSIGAQRISSDITTGYYGADVWFLIKEFPRTCLMRGIEIMTTDRSVQGVDRDAFLRDFKFFARGILSEVFGITSMWFFYGLIALVVVSLILFVICVVRKKNKYIYLLALSSIGFLGMFVTLWVQSAYPFVRVFSFIGIFIIIPIGMLYAVVAEYLTKFIKWKYVGLVLCVLAVLFTGMKLTSDQYNYEYDYVDCFALDAIRHVEWDEVGTFMVSDYYIEQQVQFHKIIGDKCELQADMDSPDVILTKKQLSGYWPDYITNEDLERCYVQEREVLYENEIYIVYGR